jgi:lipooligosaccharide transport system permease protein
VRWIAVWRRNFLVWRKLFAAAVLSNLADPLIMLFGLGYGLGALLPSVAGMSYMAFFAAGQLCTATMFTASFESMFSGFARMQGQKTWDAILYAPLTIDDIVAGEIVWAASKAWLTGSTILGVVLVFGLASSPWVLLALPAAFFVGLAFSAMGLVMCVLARGWDFFSYYMTLVMTPMMMISGVFFPAEQLPAPLLVVAKALPLYHGVQIVRPLVAGGRRPISCCTSRCSSAMLRPATRPPSTSRAKGSLPDDALGQVTAPRLHGHLVRGLFYLPRLFVYHAQADDRISIERFKLMERKLFWGIMTPGAVLTIVFGLWLWLGWFKPASGWLHAKIALVAVLAGYHLWCWRLLRDFAVERNRRSHVWFRWFNEIRCWC